MREHGNAVVVLRRGADHGGGAPHTAIYRDRTRWAIELAGPTLHARFGADELGHAAVHGKHCMGADDDAQLAPDVGAFQVLTLPAAKFGNHEYLVDAATGRVA